MTDREIEIIVLANNFHYRGTVISVDDAHITIFDNKLSKKITFPRSQVIIMGDQNES